MIDHQEIQELLQNTKLSSMADVIHFVLDNVMKIINFQPMQDLATRIAELQKPQGLDSIMIEQVKTLTQAIIQQKQQQIRRDLEKSMLKNITMAFDQQSSRQSLRQLNIAELMEKQNSRKNSQVTESKSLSLNFQHQSQLELIRREISEMKTILQRKSDRREVSDLRIDIQKALSNKITIEETEKVVQKFQKEVFNKMSETSNSLQKMQYEMKKYLMNEAAQIKRQFYESAKIVDLKQRIQKIEKKVKKIGNESIQSVKQAKVHMDVSKKQSKESLEQICNLIQNIQSKLKFNSNEIKSLSQEINRTLKVSALSGSWISDKNNVKNMSICWDKQMFNEDDQMFRFEPGKSQIIVTQPGFFRIQCLVIGCENQPQIYINSQVGLRFGQHQSTKSQIFSANELVRICESSNKIWLKLNNETSISTAFLRITKVA